MNGYNFTERVRKVLSMAREEAARLRHEYVGTEHILLGLIREGEGVAAAVLQNLSVDLEEIQQRIEETVKQGKASQATGPDLPYTSRAKKVLELAMSEARELGHSYVGTEHLLIALLEPEAGGASRLLRDAGLTADGVNAAITRIVGTPGILTDEEAAALSAIGIDIGAVRAKLEESFGPDALLAAHRRGVVHANLKPSNVFVTSDGHAKLLELGAAGAAAPESAVVGPVDSRTTSVTPVPAIPPDAAGEFRRAHVGQCVTGHSCLPEIGSFRSPVSRRRCM